MYPMDRNHHENKPKIYSGPFWVSDNNHPQNENDRLTIIITNPTKRDLSASVDIEQSSAPESFGKTTLPFVFFGENAPVYSIGPTNISAQKSLQIDLDLTMFTVSDLAGNGSLRITSTGDYEIKRNQVIAGKLEIQVLGGAGRTTVTGDPVPGIDVPDSTLTFHFSDFVTNTSNSSSQRPPQQMHPF